MTHSFTLPASMSDALAYLVHATEGAQNFRDLKEIYNIRDTRYAPLIELAQHGNRSAIRLLDMMQSVYTQANLPNEPGKAHAHDFGGFKRELTLLFKPEHGLLENLAAMEAMPDHPPTSKQAPLINGGIAASAVKSLEVTLRQIAMEGHKGNAVSLKSLLVTPILIAGLGQRALEEFDKNDEGHIVRGVNAAGQAALITATYFGALKPAVNALGKTAAGKAVTGAAVKAAAEIGIDVTMVAGGRAVPVIGFIVSETGTVIGAIGRLANGDYVGAAGTLVAGTAGNVASAVPVPIVNLVLGEVVEETVSAKFNASYESKVPVKGSTLLAVKRQMFPDALCTIVMPQKDANGNFIFHPSAMDDTRMPGDALRPHPRAANLLMPETPSLITHDEQAYLDSVARKLKGDPKLDAIVETLTAVFQHSNGNDTFLEGGALDKQLESRGVNTKTWTRY